MYVILVTYMNMYVILVTEAYIETKKVVARLQYDLRSTQLYSGARVTFTNSFIEWNCISC